MDEIYKMKCGCRISKGQLIRFRQAKKGWLCPEHLEPIDCIIKYCIDCGLKMELTTRQWAKKRCEECAHIADLRQSNECKKRKRSGIENMELAIKASAACWDCMYRDDCISVAEKDNRANKPLPCHGCKRYQRLPNAI